MTAIQDLEKALELLVEHRKITPGLGGIQFLVKQAHSKLTRADERQWFHDRIGKAIFRTDNGCNCESCQQVMKSGITIQDEMHANYLCDSSTEMGIKYFDK